MKHDLSRITAQTPRGEEVPSVRRSFIQMLTEEVRLSKREQESFFPSPFLRLSPLSIFQCSSFHFLSPSPSFCLFLSFSFSFFLSLQTVRLETYGKTLPKSLKFMHLKRKVNRPKARQNQDWREIFFNETIWKFVLQISRLLKEKYDSKENGLKFHSRLPLSTRL